MTENLKHLARELETARLATVEAGQRHAEAIARRDALAAKIFVLDATLSAAEHALAAAEASRELGEGDTTEAASEALETARKALGNKAELEHQRKVAEAVRVGLEARYLAAAEIHRGLVAQHKAAQADELRRMAAEAVEDGNRLVDELLAAGAKVDGLRLLLDAHDLGWQAGSIAADKLTLPPSQTAVMGYLEAARREVTL